MKTLQSVDSIIEKYADTKTVLAMKKVSNKNDTESFISGIVELANIFGADADFSAMLKTVGSDHEKKLLSSFHSNTQLLVQKTWIEKADETLKEKIFFQLKLVCDSLSEQKYCECYEEFIQCLENIVYLMFGSQAQKQDFTEYALRIDPEFGVFWWFLQTVANKNPKDAKNCRLYQLVVMTFLANY